MGKIWERLRKSTPIAMTLAILAVVFLTIGLNATAYEFHDESWNDTSNTVEDGVQFIILQLPNIMKLLILGAFIGIGFLVYKKASTWIGK